MSILAGNLNFATLEKEIFKMSCHLEEIFSSLQSHILESIQDWNFRSHIPTEEKTWPLIYLYFFISLRHSDFLMSQQILENRP